MRVSIRLGGSTDGQLKMGLVTLRDAATIRLDAPRTRLAKRTFLADQGADFP
jgi:hypothetical protein